MKRLKNKKLFRSRELLILNYSLLILLSSCSVSKQISKLANKTILSDSAASKGFIGISIYDPATGKYLYNYNATKYFTPASNTKLFTLYAGMKYLGDSLVGARYYHHGNTLYIDPSGDPTFLHPDYNYQPLFKLLDEAKSDILINTHTDKINKYGIGWAHDDYNESYMTERNKFPIYGNNLWLFANSSFAKNIQDSLLDKVNTYANDESILFAPKYFAGSIRITANHLNRSKISRDILINRFIIEDDYERADSFKIISIPFAVDLGKTSIEILKNIFKKDIRNGHGVGLKEKDTILHSQPTDSLFRPMMHRSDNFFAEQTLLMVSNERLSFMSDEDIIDTLLNTDLKDIPQKPKWVDGSGLSRYNLFTPQAFIYILNKLRDEFGWNRLRNILPTGGEGTLTSYFHKDSGYIYAKTGTLSNNCALSGFLLTNSGKLLIFSILANHYQSGATPIRKASERFLEAIRHRY